MKKHNLFRKRQKTKERNIPLKSWTKTQKTSNTNQVFLIYTDNLINIFKTNAIAEFMDMKKDLLEERDQIIKDETFRYVSMYENKKEEVKILRSSLSFQITFKRKQLTVRRKKNRYLTSAKCYKFKNKKQSAIKLCLKRFTLYICIKK